MFLQHYITLIIGTATACGQVLELPILVRSLLASFSSGVTDADLPMPYDDRLVNELDAGIDHDNPSSLIDQYLYDWWNLKVEPANSALSFQEAGAAAVLDHHMNRWSAREGDHEWSDLIDTTPLGSPPVVPCDTCKKWQVLCLDMLAESSSLSNLTQGLASQSASDRRRVTRSTIGFHMLHEAVILKELQDTSVGPGAVGGSTAVPTDVIPAASTSAILPAPRTRGVMKVRDKEAEELRRRVDSQPNSSKWIWGPQLDTADLKRLVKKWKSDPQNASDVTYYLPGELPGSGSERASLVVASALGSPPSPPLESFSPGSQQVGSRAMMIDDIDGILSPWATPPGNIVPTLPAENVHTLKEMIIDVDALLSPSGSPTGHIVVPLQPADLFSPTVPPVHDMDALKEMIYDVDMLLSPTASPTGQMSTSSPQPATLPPPPVSSLVHNNTHDADALKEMIYDVAGLVSPLPSPTGHMAVPSLQPADLILPAVSPPAHDALDIDALKEMIYDVDTLLSPSISPTGQTSLGLPQSANSRPPAVPPPAHDVSALKEMVYDVDKLLSPLASPTGHIFPSEHLSPALSPPPLISEVAVDSTDPQEQDSSDGGEYSPSDEEEYSSTDEAESDSTDEEEDSYEEEGSQLPATQSPHDQLLSPLPSGVSVPDYLTSIAGTIPTAWIAPDEEDDDEFPDD